MSFRYKFAVVLLLVLLAQTFAYPDKRADQVNEFYQNFIKILKSNTDFKAKKLGNLIKENRAAAETCGAKVKDKCGLADTKGKAFQELYSHLEPLLLLTSSRLKCSDEAVNKLLKAAKNQVEDDDKLYYLENIERLCPKSWEAVRELADHYLENNQSGMATKKYKRALRLRDDPDTKKLLKLAEKKLAEYKNNEPISMAKAEAVLSGKDKTMLPQRGVLGTKVQVKNAIQRQVLFDIWSYTIKPEFYPELEAVGRVAKSAFDNDDQCALLIEGHTDRRGKLDENMVLSRDRADSVKQYLVSKLGIDPNRLKTRGYGPHRPISPRDDRVGWALNRRVEFKKLENSLYE